jgi:hypothetical protein
MSNQLGMEFLEKAITEQDADPESTEEETMGEKIYEDMDEEVVPLCRALNGLDGITTVESCCGHGNTPFLIWFTADNVDDVAPVCFFADDCHTECPDWSVTVTTDCAMSPVKYLLEGPKGELGYAAAGIMAELIGDHVAWEVREDHLDAAKWSLEKVLSSGEAAPAAIGVALEHIEAAHKLLADAREHAGNT